MLYLSEKKISGLKSPGVHYESTYLLCYIHLKKKLVASNPHVSAMLCIYLLINMLYLSEKKISGLKSPGVHYESTYLLCYIYLKKKLVASNPHVSAMLCIYLLINMLYLSEKKISGLKSPGVHYESTYLLCYIYLKKKLVASNPHVSAMLCIYLLINMLYLSIYYFSAYQYTYLFLLLPV